MEIGRIGHVLLNLLCHSAKLVFSSFLACLLTIFSRSTRSRQRKLRTTQVLALFLLTLFVFALMHRVWFTYEQSRFMLPSSVASDPWTDSLRFEEIFPSQKSELVDENPCLPMVKVLAHRSKLGNAIQEHHNFFLSQKDLSTLHFHQNLSADCVMHLRLRQTLTTSDSPRLVLFKCFDNCHHTPSTFQLLKTQLQLVLHLFSLHRVTYFLDIDSAVGALKHHAPIPWQSPSVNLRIERASNSRHAQLLKSLRNEVMRKNTFALSIHDTIWKLTCIENNAVQLNIRFFQFFSSTIRLLEYKCQSFNKKWPPCSYNITDVFPVRLRPFINLWAATPRSIVNLVMTELNVDYFYVDSCPRAFSRQSSFVNCLDSKEYCDATSTLPCQYLRHGHLSGKQWQSGMNFVIRLWIRGKQQGFLELLIREITLNQVAYLPM